MTKPSYYCLMTLVVMCGCGDGEPSATVGAKATPVAMPVKLQPQLLDEPVVAAPLPDVPEPLPPVEDEPEVEMAAETFEPPYPHRENLFLAPKRSAVHLKSPGSVEQSVELLGFANVGTPKVILSINGVVVPISEGQQESGIEVISIQPPTVVLQRDRERWQVALE